MIKVHYETDKDGRILHRWGRCEDCRTKLALNDFTNTCSKCGADYNSGGSRLVDRRFWGEETGESAADIMMGGDPWGD